MTQIFARLDCVENLTRQRHDRDQTENQQNAATVDSCFELVGSRQHGVAQQKVEQPARALAYCLLLFIHVVVNTSYAMLSSGIP